MKHVAPRKMNIQSFIWYCSRVYLEFVRLQKLLLTGFANCYWKCKYLCQHCNKIQVKSWRQVSFLIILEQGSSRRRIYFCIDSSVISLWTLWKRLTTYHVPLFSSLFHANITARRPSYLCRDCFRLCCLWIWLQWAVQHSYRWITSYLQFVVDIYLNKW